MLPYAIVRVTLPRHSRGCPVDKTSGRTCFGYNRPMSEEETFVGFWRSQSAVTEVNGSGAAIDDLPASLFALREISQQLVAHYMGSRDGTTGPNTGARLREVGHALRRHDVRPPTGDGSSEASEAASSGGADRRMLPRLCSAGSLRLRVARRSPRASASDTRRTSNRACISTTSSRKPGTPARSDGASWNQRSPMPLPPGWTSTA